MLFLGSLCGAGCGPKTTPPEELARFELAGPIVSATDANGIQLRTYNGPYRVIPGDILEFQMPFIDKMMKSAKNKIDFFRLGDDFGTQQGLLMGVDQWKEFIQWNLLCCIKN